MKDPSPEIKGMGMESTITTMEIFMRVTGRKIKSRGREDFQ